MRVLHNGDRGRIVTLILAPGLRIAALALAMGGLLAACNPVRDVAVATGFGAKTPEPAQFVRDSRQSDGDYLPVGVKAEPRKLKPLTKAESDALAAKIDGRRLANESAGSTARSMGAATNARPVPKPPTIPAE